MLPPFFMGTSARKVWIRIRAESQGGTQSDVVGEQRVGEMRLVDSLRCCEERPEVRYRDEPAQKHLWTRGNLVPPTGR